MTETEIQSLSTKIDQLVKAVNQLEVLIAKLPCPVHEQKFNDGRWTIGLLWGAIAMLAGWIKTKG